MNPLFTDEPSNTSPRQPDGYVLARQERRLEPLPGGQQRTADANSAVDYIRNKIDALYAEEPNAKQELTEAKEAPKRSKHQEVMHQLSTSGKSLAEIQAAWHQYYTSLNDTEKRAVWQEFYAANDQHPSAYTQAAHQQATAHTRDIPTPHAAQQPTTIKPDPKIASRRRGMHPEKPAGHTTPKAIVSQHENPPYARYAPGDKRTLATIKKHVIRTVRSQTISQARAKQHLQSLIFGIGLGALVLLIVLFGLFNNLIIAPFIRPGSNNASATPIILSTDGIAPTDQDQVIIPKINAELPFSTGAGTDEESIQSGLEEGVVRYPSTSEPGQKGNAAFFGHSSNNIFNKGKYKFAFVLLHELVPGDIFYLTHKGKVYTYKVYDKKIVNPDETWVLNTVQDKVATATLITCDPPGTTLHRLVVWGEQVNPDPVTNVDQGAPAAVDAPAALPSDGPSLWSRIWDKITFW